MSDNIAQRAQHGYFNVEEVQKEVEGSVVLRIIFDPDLLTNFENDDSGHPTIVVIRDKTLEKGEMFGPYMITDIVWATAPDPNAALLITAKRQ
jgi:hypothetical protein